jgi:iron complex outermembrane receptor protein
VFRAWWHDAHLSCAIVSNPVMRSLPRYLHVLSPLALILAGPTFAAEEPVDVIVVTVSRQATKAQDTPAAIDVVERADLRLGQPQINLSESLSRVPGLVIQNRQNYAQDLQISSRGFGSRASFGIRGIKLIVDDIPATIPDGQGQGAVFPLSTLSRIEVLRGPWAVAYGNASGGVINAFSEPAGAEPGAGVSLLGGSYGQRKWDARVSAATDSARVLVDANRFTTDGYRDHSRTVREQSYAKANFTPRESDSLTLTAGSLDQPETQDPLGLTRAQFEENPRQAGAGAVQFDTRKSVRHRQGGAVYEAKARGLDIKLLGYTGTRRVEQFLSTPVGAQVPATSSGGVVDLDREFAGTGLRIGQQGERQQWVAGLDHDVTEERRRGFNNFSDDVSHNFSDQASQTPGVAGRLRRSELNTVTGSDVFAQGTWRFDERFSVQAGVRTSRTKFDSRDDFVSSGNGDDSGRATYRNTSPAAGLLFKQSPEVNWYASVSRGFETPTFAELAYRRDGRTGLNFDLQPSKSRNAEIGAKVRVAKAWRLDVAVFDITTDREIVPATNSGGRTTFQNAGKTSRRGIELGGDWNTGGDWSAALALAYLNAKFEDGFVSSNTVSGVTTTRTVESGNRLPGVPRETAFAEVAWRKAKPGFSAALEMVRRGKMPADDRNTAWVQGFTAWNLRLMHSAQLGGAELASFVRIDNVLDRKYAGSVIVNEANERYFESAPGRSGFVGTNATWRFR